MESMGVVIRRYIDFHILFIPTTLVSALFGSSIPTFLFIFKMFFVLFWYFFVIYVIIFCAVYKSLQLLLYTPWLVCMCGVAK